ncbi:MAG: GTPase [Deltaproteobacteria bacterium]|nr:GTPase [Deltaproteobacteria bacterium]
MKKIVIMGAAGKDFHVFNTTYRQDPNVKVIAFTAAQIPNISGRKYPPQLAGPLYPEGIPIKSERGFDKFIRENGINEVVFAYSDVSYDYVAEREKKVKATGASFKTFDIAPTLLKSTKPVVAICAVRTGCGKSPTSRAVIKELLAMGKKVVAIRHPMPYGNLVKQEVQRFATLEDLKSHHCTIEEMEEYEPHIRNGVVVYAGVDYEKILREAEKEADVIIWDGGNNDTPCIKPDLHMTLVDPLRPGHEVSFFPGRVNVEMADVILMTKISQAKKEDIETVENNIRRYNPKAKLIKADIVFEAENPDVIKGKRVLVIEDGPTLTHGGMKFGAGILAAQKYGAAETIDPKPYVVGTFAEAFQEYDIGPLLPALGYGEQQMSDLEATIRNCKPQAVIIATPIDLSRIIKIDVPSTRVTYELQETQPGSLRQVLSSVVKK